MERLSRWVIGVAVWICGGVALAQESAPIGPAQVTEWSTAMREAGGWGVSVVELVIFGGTIVYLWKTGRTDRAAYDAKLDAMQAQVVQLLKDFLHEKK